MKRFAGTAKPYDSNIFFWVDGSQTMNHWNIRDGQATRRCHYPFFSLARLRVG
jgi:hypothetical protein